MQLNTNKIISLCKKNKSNKSTLIKILYNIYPHNSYKNKIIFTKKKIQTNHIHNTKHKNITIIHQKLTLIKKLTILKNIFLNNKITHNNIINYNLITLHYQKLLTQINLSISPNTHIGNLKLKQQQLIKITKTLNKQIHLLILNEPTTSLTKQKTSILLNIIHNLQQHNITYIYISHKLNKIKTISNTICIIHNKQHINTHNTTKMNKNNIITIIIKQKLTTLYPNKPHTTKNKILHIKHLTTWHPINHHIKQINNISFSLKHNKILNITKLINTKHTKTIQYLFNI